LKNKEIKEVYEHKVKILGELEDLSEDGLIDLYYSDESKVSLEPCIPYGWQFPGEEVFMPTQKGNGLNCFALLKRNNECLIETTQENINGQFILERLEDLSTKLKKMTVIVLDNARIHTCRNYQRTNQSVAAKRLVSLLFAEIFATFEYRLNLVAKVKI